MSRFQLTEPSEDDIADLWTYIGADSPDSADRMVDRILERCAKIARRPGMGRRRDDLRPGMRCSPVGHYLIFYRLLPDCVEILRVMSGYRDLEAAFREG